MPKQVQITAEFVRAATDIVAKVGDRIIIYAGVAIGVEPPDGGVTIGERHMPSDRAVAVHALWELLMERGPLKSSEIYLHLGLKNETEHAECYKDLNAGVAMGRIAFESIKSNEKNMRGTRVWEAIGE